MRDLYSAPILWLFMLVSTTVLNAQSFLETNENCELRATIYGNYDASLVVVVWEQSRIDSILNWIEKEKIKTPAQTGSVRPFLTLQLFRKDNDKPKVKKIIQIYKELDSSGKNLHTTYEQRKALLHLLLWKDFSYLFEDYK